jgi:20S proteasome subunit alpha 6
VIGCDETGPHVYQTIPSGDYFEYIAQAMGKRSQSARTYLEKYFKEFKSMELGNLIEHSLKALKGASATPLTSKNVAIAYVGKNQKYTTISGEKLAPYMSMVEEEKKEEKKQESKE